MRSRLSSMNRKSRTICFKIGLLLISTDLALMLFPLIQHPLWTAYEHNACIITRINPFVLLWIVLSDIIIGSYCLLVFVLPLREHIKYERSISNRKLGRGFPSNSMIPSSAGSNSSSIRKNSDKWMRDSKSIQLLVRKIMLYSTLMILSTICIMSTVWLFNLTHFGGNLHIHILSNFGPIHMTFTVYCVILQFSDVDTSKIQCVCCRGVVTCFQCTCCWQCDCCSNEDDEDIDVIKEEEQETQKATERAKRDDEMKSTDLSIAMEMHRNTSDTTSVFTTKSEISCIRQSTANSETVEVPIGPQWNTSTVVPSSTLSVHVDLDVRPDEKHMKTERTAQDEQTNSEAVPTAIDQMKLTLNVRSESAESGEDDPEIE